MTIPWLWVRKMIKGVGITRATELWRVTKAFARDGQRGLLRSRISHCLGLSKREVVVKVEQLRSEV